MKLLKTTGKHIVTAILGWQVRRLQKKNTIKTIGVVGSYGKTSTKLAITTVLGQRFKVRSQSGNYNQPESIPLVFFGEEMPSLFNPFAWLFVFLRNEQKLRKKYPYEVVVLELGSDSPGQIPKFKSYLNLDFTVITALSEEHMEQFITMQAVVAEELAAQEFSKQIIYNADLCPAEYIQSLKKPVTSFGYTNGADFQLKNVRFKDNAYHFQILKDKAPLLEAVYPDIAKPQLYSACAATIIAHRLGVSNEKIITGIAAIKPFSGRLQTLKGIKDSIILDETYNSSPPAAKAALDVLYSLEAPQKTALLGNMNELGSYSEAAHKEVGDYCDPRQLDLVLTLGPDANNYLASAAEERGCKVIQFDNPYKAGEYLKENLKPGAAILVKGSQNRVFAEEAVKLILADPADVSKLVRQSPQWLKQKSRSFNKS